MNGAALLDLAHFRRTQARKAEDALYRLRVETRDLPAPLIAALDRAIDAAQAKLAAGDRAGARDAMSRLALHWDRVFAEAQAGDESRLDLMIADGVDATALSIALGRLACCTVELELAP